MTTTTTHRGRHRRSPWLGFGPVAVALALLAVLILTACGSIETESAASERPTKTTVRVLYEVEGTADYASVTFATPTGARQANPDVPMKRKTGERGLEFSALVGTFVYISAQNKRGHGTISCRITVDGVVISENESSGGYAIASCEGMAR